MMGPMMAVRPIAPLLAVLAVLALATAELRAQAPTNAADEYDRLGRMMQEFEGDPDGPWQDRDGQSTERFFDEGEIDPRMQRWLDRARPLAGDLIRATRLAYDRPLDRSQGFSLLLPHYGAQRAIVRGLDALMVDAIRREPAMFVQLLEAQATVAERSAEDGLLISSLVAMSCGEKSRARLADMVDRGLIDAELARGALSAVGLISDKDALGLGGAVESEHGMLALEIDRIAEAEGDDRARRFNELMGLAGRSGAPDSAAFDEEALTAFPSQLDALRDAQRAIVDAPTREAAAKAAAELDAAVASGAYGDILKALAPAVGNVVDRAWRYDADWSLVRSDLTALADGTKSPEDLMDAGIHYLRAAGAARQLRVPEQAEFDALRLAGDLLEPSLQSNGKLLLARVQSAITAEVYRGSQLGRLRLDDRPRAARPVVWNSGFVRATQPGIHGAVRTMLAAGITADAGPAAAPAPVSVSVSVSVSASTPAPASTSVPPTAPPIAKPVAPTPQELAVAAVRVAAHYASTEQFGHSLAALAMLTDAADAIEHLRARDRFDAAGKALLSKALARLAPDDPIGLARATAAERLPLRTVFADEKRVAQLSAGEVAFLVAALAKPDAPLAAADCDCPDHGPLLDMRGWFDATALAKLGAARDHLKSRGERARATARAAARTGDGTARIPGSPLEGLDVTPPFDADRARESARAVVERLRALSE